MLEEKNYKVKIIGSFTGESPEKKTPYIGLELETNTGEFIDWVGWLSDKAYEKDGKSTNAAKESMKSLKGAGFIGSKLSDLSNASMSIEDLFEENPDLSVKIKHEEYTDKNGEIRTKAVVQYINTGKGGMTKFDHKQAVVSIDSKYGDLMKQISSQLSTKTRATKKEEATEDFNHDDIPF